MPDDTDFNEDEADRLEDAIDAAIKDADPLDAVTVMAAVLNKVISRMSLDGATQAHLILSVALGMISQRIIEDRAEEEAAGDAQ